ncbi:MAG TPA: DNA topoisomerase IV subunit A [Dongiaceae bacterium]|jgi:topoisomerase-4 subunit A|nr:DNA topoisomerase IV subunit A [Dongiaceae bacterium]
MARKSALALPENPATPVPLAEALAERYLSYALSTIVSRSLPDVRDGLKPVHRRLLYAMRQLRLEPGQGYKKSARVVGDVIGKFHPHGDSAIYDAMVRLAQDFAQRYPLVDGQGNFGNIDGDNAAAMRYTEARLTEAAALLLQHIDDDTVDFRPTYDGSEQEPVVLPAAFPNLLANGAQGIAVGMATSIPPHNVAEICDALLHLIKSPKARIETLVELMPGPDFPTGGVLCESRETLVEAYRTGRGSLRIRARWNVEKLKGGTWQIVITEIPYQVVKARLLEKIGELLNERRLSFLEDCLDESTTDLRIVLVPRSRTLDPGHIMEQMFRETELESRFGMNMNALDAQQIPRLMSLPDLLNAYLTHRREILQRRSAFRLGAIERRLEILDGLLIAYLNLDAVIALIRKEDEPKPVMMRKWQLSETQAEAILNMRLRALRKLEEIEITREHKMLSAERKELKALLKDEARQWATIAGEISDLKKLYGLKTPLGRRHTEIGTAPAALVIPLESMVEKEPITIICSDKGWIRALKGHVERSDEIKFKEGDRGKFHLHAQTTDKVLLFATNGKAYSLPADRLPGGRGHGEPVRLMIDLGNDQDIVALRVFRPDGTMLVASDDGRGFVIAERDMIAQTKSGKQILNLGDGAEASVCTPADGDMVATIGDNRKLLIFPIAQVPVMARGRGVILQKYKDGGLADAKVFSKASGLSWRLGEKIRTETALSEWIGDRAQAGRLPPQGFPRGNLFGT